MFISNFCGFLLDEFGMLSRRAGFSATPELSCFCFSRPANLRKCALKTFHGIFVQLKSWQPCQKVSLWARLSELVPVDSSTDQFGDKTIRWTIGTIRQHDRTIRWQFYQFGDRWQRRNRVDRRPPWRNAADIICCVQCYKLLTFLRLIFRI